MEDLEEDGLALYVAVSREENHSQRRYDHRSRSVRDNPGKVVTDPYLVSMREKLQTDAGRRTYTKRLWGLQTA